MQKNTFSNSLVVGIILLLVGAGVAAGIYTKSFDNSQPMNRGWLYVGGSGPGNYTTIQSAIDAATPGDTIFVYNGTYYENIIVNKILNLTGENENTTIIDGSDSGDVVYVSADWVNISGFTIQNSGTSNWPIYDCGIETISNYCSITDNILIDNDNGIYLNNADHNLIINNDISSNPLATIGIMLEYSNSNIVDDNYVHYNYHGIELQHSNLNVISTNNLIDNNNSGVWLRYSSYNNSLYHNNFINNTWSDNNNVVDECSNVWYNATLQEGNYYDDYVGVDNNGDGIGDTPYNISGGSNQDLYPLMYPYYPTHPDTVYVDDDFDKNTTGWGYDKFNRIQYGINEVPENGTVYVYNGTYYENIVINKDNINLIGEDKNITIIDGGNISYTIYVNACSTKITNFTLKKGLWHVVHYDYYSNNNYIMDNIISQSGSGIVFQDCLMNNIINNIIENNTGNGIHFANNEGEWGNRIIGNTIRYNYNGIYTYDAINLNPNIYYHNNFIQNTRHAVYYFQNAVDIWNDSYPSGGNYWDDYTGADNYYGPNQNISGSDGIGDTPYLIPGGINQDNYPFMEPDGWLKNPPNKPNRPSGIAHGKAGVLYIYTTNTTDPDGDQLYYKWDWGDGSYSDWLGPNISGMQVSASHGWSNGSFEIKVKAKDIYGAESNWSDPLLVTMPKNKAFNFNHILLDWLFERYLSLFPILKIMLLMLQV